MTTDRAGWPDMTTDDLMVIVHDSTADFDTRAAAADLIATRNRVTRDAAHAAFHGHPLRYGRVGRDRWHRGDTVCLDCYWGRPWDGRV